MEHDSIEFADKFLDFHFRMWKWRAKHYAKEFNINGKGKKELTMRKFATLWIMYYLGITTISEMEEIVNTSKSSLSTVISRLEADGYLLKTPPPEGDDGRKVYLVITEKGKRAVKESYKKLREGVVVFYESLEGNRQRELEEGIDKLMNVFE